MVKKFPLDCIKRHNVNINFTDNKKIFNTLYEIAKQRDEEKLNQYLKEHSLRITYGAFDSPIYQLAKENNIDAVNFLLNKNLALAYDAMQGYAAGGHLKNAFQIWKDYREKYIQQAPLNNRRVSKNKFDIALVNGLGQSNHYLQAIDFINEQKSLHTVEYQPNKQDAFDGDYTAYEELLNGLVDGLARGGHFSSLTLLFKLYPQMYLKINALLSLIVVNQSLALKYFSEIDKTNQEQMSEAILNMVLGFAVIGDIDNLKKYIAILSNIAPDEMQTRGSILFVLANYGFSKEAISLLDSFTDFDASERISSLELIANGLISGGHIHDFYEVFEFTEAQLSNKLSLFSNMLLSNINWLVSWDELTTLKKLLKTLQIKYFPDPAQLDDEKTKCLISILIHLAAILVGNNKVSYLEDLLLELNIDPYCPYPMIGTIRGLANVNKMSECFEQLQKLKDLFPIMFYYIGFENIAQIVFGQQNKKEIIHLINIAATFAPQDRTNIITHLAVLALTASEEIGFFFLKNINEKLPTVLLPVITELFKSRKEDKPSKTFILKAFSLIPKHQQLTLANTIDLEQIFPFKISRFIRKTNLIMSHYHLTLDQIIYWLNSEARTLMRGMKHDKTNKLPRDIVATICSYLIDSDINSKEMIDSANKLRINDCHMLLFRKINKPKTILEVISDVSVVECKFM